MRPNKLAWYGTTRLFDPLSLIFRQSADGLMIAHTYRYSRTHSTFLVECDPQTYVNAGLDRMSEAESLAYCERAFAEDLQGEPLLSNRSDWFNYPIVKNRRWHAGNVVLLGDALRTGHPSVGSGTRLAMQDSIALFEAIRAHADDVPALLEAFERMRRPGSDALAGGGDPQHRVVREPSPETGPGSGQFRVRLPHPHRPGDARRRARTRPGARGSL